MTLIQPLSALVLTFGFLLVLAPIARRFNLIDIPGGRKQHQMATPLVGGIDHLHHRLMRAGLSRGQVVAGMFCTAALFGAAGLAAWYYSVPQSVMFWSFIGLFLAYLLSNWLYARTHSTAAA